MHAVINHIHTNKPVRNVLESMEVDADGLPLLSSLPGFRGFYAVEEAADRAALVILWESREAAMNGAQVVGPGWFHKNIAPHLASEQARTLGEVFIESHP